MNKIGKTGEPHREYIGDAQLGAMHAESFAKDPKHLGFVLARYHFVARMLQGKDRVLELGCGDGTAAPIVQQRVGHLTGIDREPQPTYPGKFIRGDIRESLPRNEWKWQAIFALDVLEHIFLIDEDRFLCNIVDALDEDVGVCIIGTPSKESQPWASDLSRKHHVNCKTEEDLRGTMRRHFLNVFIFGMNDSTLHTGFGPMCHYRFAVCTDPY